MNYPINPYGIDEVTLEVRETDRIESLLNVKSMKRRGVTASLELQRKFDNPSKNGKIRSVAIYHIYFLENGITQDGFYLGILNCVDTDEKNYEVKKHFKYRPREREIERLFSIKVREE